MNKNKQSDDIYPIPKIPPEIKEAVSNSKLVIFIGAGASRIIGCSGWQELANQLVDAAHECKLINYQEKEKIVEDYGPRKAITILKQYLPKDLYKNTLGNALTEDKKKSSKYPIYESLFKMRGIYLTTNVDIYFDKYFEKPKTYIDIKQFKSANITPLSLFHLHGSINNFDQMIFSTQEYINHYNRKDIQLFLKRIFSEYTVLFIGYSLSELEIIDYVMLKSNSSNKSSTDAEEARHFILLPFFKAEKNMFKFEREYFQGINLKAIPYAIDENGHEQLFSLVNAWEKEINITSPFLYKSYKFIEENINDYKEDKAVEIFQLIKNDEHFENHFFKNVNTVKWFLPLKDKGYFQALKTKYLPYLERVSEQINIPENEQYIDELLTIISNVSKDKNAYGLNKDVRTWWYFVKILLNIPNDKIPIDIIGLIPIWISSEDYTELSSSDIATKLLPKFLNDSLTQEDVLKAEMIIEYITALKIIPLKEERASFFSENRDIRLAIKPYYLQEAFNKYSIIIGKECSRKVIDNLVTKIKILLKRENSFIHFDIEEEVYYLTLFELDTKYVIRLASGKWTSLDEMAKEITSDSKSPNVVTELIIDKCNKIDFENNVFKELKKNKKLTKLKPNILRRGIKNLYCNFYDKETYHSFYEESDYPLEEPLRLLTFILKRILISKSTNDIKESKTVLKEFLEDKYFYFHKMAIYIIGLNIKTHDDMFWELLDKDIGNDILQENIYFGDELKHLFQNLVNITEKQREKLKDMIEAGPRYYADDEDPKEYLSHWKQQRYQALIHDSYFKDLYEINKKISKKDTELRPAIGKVEVCEVLGISPLTKDDILKIKNTELAKYLSTFKSKDIFSGPNVDGLANTLKEIAHEQPERFINDFTPFLDSGFLYVYRIIWGICDAVNKKKIVDWDKLLNFIKQYIGREVFWQDKIIVEDDDHWNANHEWVVGIIGELIQAGTKYDDLGFNDKQVLIAQEILIMIIQNLKVGDKEDISDTVTHALNTPFGKIITAMIYLALYQSRAEVNEEENKEREVKWNSELKDGYEKLLKDEVIEAYTLLGKFLPNLAYLDKAWVEQKIKELENIKEQNLWLAFMDGYLFPSHVYNDLYDMMKNHYLIGITCSFNEKHTEEKLIQHICVGYLRGVENFSENSLFGKVLKIWNPSHINEILSYFGMQRKSLTKNTDDGTSVSDKNEIIINKIIEFWRWLYERYKDIEVLDDNDKKILSLSGKLAVFLDKIDKNNINWLLQSSPYVDINFSSYFFIKQLDKLKNKGDRIESARYLGMIYLKMLETCTPNYDHERIKSIVEFLYETGDEKAIDSANKIFNIYESRGIEFLRDIYEKYNDV